jgi:glycosyltransferase involved in cell wall biosynthesis
VRYVVVVPTYNERENLPLLAERLAQVPRQPDILVVDDASPDGTGDVADALAEHTPTFNVMHRTGPRGYSAASRDGLAWALERGYDYVCTMDADLSHDPAALPAMLGVAEAGHDVVIGSRYVEGGSLDVGWGPVRRAVSRAGSAYARAMLGVRVRDCTSGFRCYRREALARFEVDSIHSEGYCFLIEVLDRARRNGSAVKEVPIKYIDRQAGRSKISRRIVLEALARTTALGASRLLGR